MGIDNDSSNYRLDERWQGHGPRELRIEITHDCPLRCLHCSTCSEKGDSMHLQPHVILAAVKEFKAMGGEKIILTGGEPVVHPELIKILKLINEIGMRPKLFSSGITHEDGGYRPTSQLEVMRLKPLVSGVVLSLYSDSPVRHERITQTQNSFSMCIDAIRTYIKCGIPTDVHFVPMRPNYEDLLDVAYLANSLGVHKIHVLRFIPHGRGEEYAIELLPSAENFLDFGRKVEMTRKMFPGFLDIGASFQGILPGINKRCSAVTDKLVITADGFVFPCDGFKNLMEHDDDWNINKKPLREIYLHSPMLKCLRAAKKYDIANQSISKMSGNCSSCMAQRAVRGSPFYHTRVQVPTRLV